MDLKRLLPAVCYILGSFFFALGTILNYVFGG